MSMPSHWPDFMNEEAHMLDGNKNDVKHGPENMTSDEIMSLWHRGSRTRRKIKKDKILFLRTLSEVII